MYMLGTTVPAYSGVLRNLSSWLQRIIEHLLTLYLLTLTNAYSSPGTEAAAWTLSTKPSLAEFYESVPL